ncbi:MAG: hypothetical protein R6U04_04000, partial [Bacteroidales bacterium]
ILGLNLGASVYIGNTQSTLYEGINKTNNTAMEKADSSTVGVAMLGFDLDYSTGGAQFKGQFYYTPIYINCLFC